MPASLIEEKIDFLAGSLLPSMLLRAVLLSHSLCQMARFTDLRVVSGSFVRTFMASFSDSPDSLNPANESETPIRPFHLRVLSQQQGCQC